MTGLPADSPEARYLPLQVWGFGLIRQLLFAGCAAPGVYRPVRMLTRYDHLLARLDAPPSGELTYYSGGAWDKAGRITSSQDWFAYLRQYAQQRRNPPRITVGK